MFDSEDVIGVGFVCYFICVCFSQVIWLMSYKKNTCFSIYPFLYSSYGMFYLFFINVVFSQSWANTPQNMMNNENKTKN